MREPRNSKIWGSGGVQRQRYAAITARECLTALSMIKIPQMYKKCRELAPGDHAGCCHRGEATCWQTEGAKELALKTIQGGLTALFLRCNPLVPRIRVLDVPIAILPGDPLIAELYSLIMIVYL